MKFKASYVRTRLDLLLRTLTQDDRKPPIFSIHGEVPDWFLSENGIRLVSQEFDNTDDSAVINLSHDPSILFSPLPLETFEKYPIIGPETYPHPKIAEAMLAYSDYKKTPELSSRVSFTLHFLERWAGCFARKGTLSGFIHLRELPGLTRVRPCHGLFAGVPFVNNFGHRYDAHLFEYDGELERFAGDKSHLVMLAEIKDYGFNGSISFGDLALLITAMRNRALQRYGFVASDSESDNESPEEGNVPVDEGFLFENEQRFPVLMVSIVGLQHARILYACMDGLKIVIRQSKKYNLLKKDEETLNFFSSILLSSPLEDGQLAELIQK